MIKRVLLLTSLMMGLHNSLWAVAADGTYDFSGFTDPGNDLISTNFILSGTVDGLVGNMTLLSPIAYGGNDAYTLDPDVCVYKLSADGINTGSFVVTDVNLRDFSTNSSNDNFYLVGNVAGAGTVQSGNTLSGLANNGVQDVITGSALDLTPFAGVQVTSFEVRFSATTSCENLDFNSFTISNALAPNTAPTITSDGSGATAAINAAENQTAVTTVMATDSDVGAVLTYSISGGADQGKFVINSSTGVLTFLAAPDFEIPGDVGMNNVYDVQVTVSDGSLTDIQDIAVTVTDVYDADSDSDTIYDNVDNCVNAPNTDQLDTDGDGIGDVCDAFVNNDLNTTPSVTAPADALISINTEGNNEVNTTQPDGTVTAAITYPSDGTTGHAVIQLNGTVTSARVMAPGADIVISDNGDVNSSVQVNGIYVNVQATSDGNATHQLSIEINGTLVTTEATVGFGGANTLVDADGSIETNATLADVNGTLISYVINAEINGSSSYRVYGGDFNTTVHASVPGASTYLGADGNITLATPTLNVNGNMVEALVTTNAQGESYTYFRVTKPDLSVIITPTLNAINRFEPGNSVIINDFDGFYEFIVQTPLNAPLLF